MTSIVYYKKIVRPIVVADEVADVTVQLVLRFSSYV